jgi:hypothetical protein
MLHVLPLFFFLLTCSSVFGQEKFTVLKDLKGEWMTYEESSYKPVMKIPVSRLNTVYFELHPARYPAGAYLRLQSDKSYFLFINGKVRGEYQGQVLLNLDSLAQAVYNGHYLLAIHQKKINGKDLISQVILRQPPSSVIEDTAARPYSHFRDFVVIAGLLIILLFVLAMRLNPKLAAEYFSIPRMFSSRDADDSQASARLTSSSNVQFYILCSLLIGFYLLIILYNLPPNYALPNRFYASGFWMISWQWLKLSVIIFYVFVLKIFIILSLTHLFGMRGMARFHFFNWMRLLLVVFGSATVVLFIYFISHGTRYDFFVVFLSLMVAALITWIVVAFFKLSGRNEHSVFHLFSYLCATEIIPLLITVKVLFQ